MKECPRCRTRYTDDSLQFCLQDGTPLAVVPTGDEEAETVVASRHAAEPTVVSASPNTYVSPPRRSRMGLIVALTVLATVMIFTIGGLAAWLLLRGDGKTDRSSTNGRNQTNAGTATPTQTATPSPSPSTSPANVANSNINTTPPVNKNAVSRDVADAIERWKDDTESYDTDSLMGHYADRVDYFKTNGASKGTIAQDKERAFSQFDTVNFRISNINVNVSDTGDEATAEFDKEWHFEGDHVSEGKVRSQLKFKKVGNRWLITSEKDLKVY